MDTPALKIVGSVDLSHHHSNSKTRHTIGGRVVSEFTRLELANAEGQSGYYLLYFRSAGSSTDTWHQSLEDALHQAEWEFGVGRHEWRMV